MIRIEVQVETNDPTLRDYVLGDIETWRRTPAKVSVSTREEDPWSGNAETVRISSSRSMHVAAVGAEAGEEDQPHVVRRYGPPERITLEAARTMAEFPVFAVRSPGIEPSTYVRFEPGGADLPPSVVAVHVVDDDRGRQRGNVWVTSSPAPLPSSRFEVWRTVEGHDVTEDRSGGYYRCKVRVAFSENSFVQVESTAHRILEEVLDMVAALHADQ